MDGWNLLKAADRLKRRVNLAEEVVSGIREWRVQYPKATFWEIEAALEVLSGQRCMNPALVFDNEKPRDTVHVETRLGRE